MLDFFKRKPAASPAKEIGDSGTLIIGYQVQDDEKNRDLSGRKKYDTYSNNLANIGIVGAGVRFFLNYAAAAKWTFEPADDSSESERYADLTKEILNGMKTPWHNVVRRACAYKFWGFSIQEWTTKKREDGSIGFYDVAPRPQSTIYGWDADEKGKITSVIQESPWTYQQIHIPYQKVVHIVDDSLNDSPEGLGLFRHIADSCKRLLRYMQLEGYGFESDLQGMPIARAPSNRLAEQVKSGEMTNAEMNAMLKPLKNIIKNHIKSPSRGILLDSEPYEAKSDTGTVSTVYKWDFEVIKSSSESFESINTAINRLVTDIAMTLGVEGMLVGVNGRGSQSLSEDKSQNFVMMVDSALKEVCESFKKSLIDNLWKINGWPEDYKPTMKPEVMKNRSITELTQALKDVASAGAPITRADKALEELFEMIGLSKLEGDDVDLSLNNTGRKMPDSFDLGDLDGSNTGDQ
jgi:hypothetical protein